MCLAVLLTTAVDFVSVSSVSIEPDDSGAINTHHVHVALAVDVYWLLTRAMS